MKSDRIKEVTQLTKDLMHSFYDGNLEVWFDALRKDCIWVGSGEPLLFGAESIKNHFQNYTTPRKVKVFNENYQAISLSSNAYIVTGQLSLGSNENLITASTLITIAYRYVGSTPKIIYQHMSYDYTQHFSLQIKNENLNHAPHLPMDASYRIFMTQLLTHDEEDMIVPIKVGKQMNYIDPKTIIYLNSHGHKTTIHCIDQVIDSSMNIYEFKSLLSHDFYSLRRGYIINIKYITAIRRSEVELSNGMIIQIPVPTYTKVKKELNECIKK